MMDSSSPFVPQADPDPKPETFNMDETEHIVGKDCHCGPESYPKCSCGGLKHFQGVYGGFYYECEDCHKTSS